MPHVKPDIESVARIKVVGVGGSGKNAVNHMVRSKVRGVEFIAINTDAQDLHQSLAHKKIRIGRGLTKGLGTGMSPDVGRQAAEETKDEINEALKGADMVFVTCGMGGGTGTGAAPIISQIAKSNGALTIGVITRPFSFEGLERARIAEAGIVRFREAVDAMIAIPNDKLLSVVQKDTSLLSAFGMCDEVLRQAVEGIADLITIPGIINVDFADVRAIMQNAGSALMGIGFGRGESRAEDAARVAINSPLLDLSVSGARGVLFTVAGGADITMWEVQEAAKVITASIDPDAKVIFGAAHDDRVRKGDLKITVIASGFPDGTSSMKSATLFGPLAKRQVSLPASNTLGGNGDGGEKHADTGASPGAESEWDTIPAFMRRTKRS